MGKAKIGRVKTYRVTIGSLDTILNEAAAQGHSPATVLPMGEDLIVVLPEQAMITITGEIRAV